MVDGRYRMGDGRLTSADQDTWVELAQAVRAHLVRYAALMPEMEVAELKDFVETCRDALFFELNAADFDGEIDRSGLRLFPDDD